MAEKIWNECCFKQNILYFTLEGEIKSTQRWLFLYPIVCRVGLL